MKKIIIIVMLILLTSGCSDYRELSDMAMISNIAIDKEDDKYKVIVQVLDSSQSKSGEGSLSPSVTVYDSEGKTLHEAFRNVTLESPKKLYIGHVDTVLIGENAVKEGVSEFIDFILRDPEIEKDFNLIISSEPVKDAMNVLPPLVSIPSENVSSSIEIASEIQGMVTNVSFDEFVSNILVKGIDPVLPTLYIKKVETDNEEINPEKRLVLSKKLGIFKDDKLVNYLNDDASLGYNLLNNEGTSSIISFKCDKDAYASIELLGAKSGFTYDKDKNVIKIKMDLTGTLSELNCNMDISKEKEVKELEEMLKKRIKEILDEMITSLRMNNSDFVGIGKYLYQNDYKYYSKNKDKLQEKIKDIKAEYDINITYTQKTSIKRGDEKY